MDQLALVEQGLVAPLPAVGLYICFSRHQRHQERHQPSSESRIKTLQIQIYTE
ncbi:GPI transamidase component PIG-S [Aspergillus luchuensis]|uniref:GPI transamidase component PIG-S n=1 Tax=Aspergillus kawachii TaxID=1069201 RepID=A0A146FF05_ASPKA|nr:GPI transamidase component PIG-S [Aspergillus luchuensis]